ncbi:P-glycoprotein [Neoconidiobolus thromboides FSU 785]|nr:P-glycoprotein [Neoconidiobolus thromboides FSU 785]
MFKKKSSKEKEGSSNSKTKLPTISLFKLFQFATTNDKVIIFLAILFSIVNGLSQPALYLLFSEIIAIYGEFQSSFTANPEAAALVLYSQVNTLCISMAIVGVVTFISSYLQLSLWLLIGESQCMKLRKKYLSSILSQEISFFDNNNTGEITNIISKDINIIQEGISDKIGLLIQYTSCFLGSFIVAFVKGWKLTLVMLTSVPLVALAGVLMSKFIADDGDDEGSYGAANSIAKEVLSSIKTIYSFNSQLREYNRYNQKILKTCKKGLRKAIYIGFGNGTFLLIIFSSYALAIWYGAKLIFDNEYEPRNVLIVFFNILSGSMVLGMTAPSIIAITLAKSAAIKLFQIIEKESLINPFIETEENIQNQSKITPVIGNVTFDNIYFNYPTRIEDKILKGVSFTVENGQTIALVGASGSGKSTCIKLLQRFYNPTHGSILLDNTNINQLSIKFLKQQIGLVNQEPILFSTTIKQNILLGLKEEDGNAIDNEVFDNKVIEVCKLCNIHDFIIGLPNGYDTLVGENGSQLSGGQKQRIAIARAIIKNPKILLLDEATSALDTSSEKLVQQALDKVSVNRTTIVIAHRLSTICKADKIIVFDQGKVVETGDHKSLIELNGVYNKLVQSQMIHLNDKEIEKEEKETTINNNINNTIEKSIDNLISIKIESDNQQKTNKNKAIKSTEPIPLIRILKIAFQWKKVLILGIIGAILDGCVFPIFSLLLTEATQLFLNLAQPELKETAQISINFRCLMFLLLSIGCFIAGFLKNYSFNYIAEKITYKIRGLYFKSLLQQEIGYFDQLENNVGNLTSKLSKEAQDVHGLIGKFLGPLISAIACAIFSLIVAFLNGWKLTLVGLITIPFTTYGQLMQVNALTSVNQKMQLNYLSMSEIAMECIQNNQTISSLNKEEYFLNQFNNTINQAHKTIKFGILKSSFGYSTAMAAPLFSNALLFWYGTILILTQEYQYQNMFQIITSIMFLGIFFGFASAELTSFIKCKLAAIEIFSLIDRIPKINSSDYYGTKNIPLEGNITMKDAHFSYPSRPNAKVLNGLDLSILKGQKVAIVGTSGSGKSTIVSLIQHFYELNSGNLNIESEPITSWNIPYLRSSISLVGQEPVLFNLTIAENIAYGSEFEVTEEEVISASKLANAHDFILQLPDGYKTLTGEKGNQLSGGQKQRIAIARALIRNPKLLLLDEATSALDSNSEKVVQIALDKAAEGRTTIMIAHRLSGIQLADKIIVMNKGKVVEVGNHQELLRLNGEYLKLVKNQAL